MQDINSVKILDKNITIDRIILIVSRTKVEALTVNLMMLCFPAISLGSLNLMSCNVDGVESLTAAPYYVLLIV